MEEVKYIPGDLIMLKDAPNWHIAGDKIRVVVESSNYRYVKTVVRERNGIMSHQVIESQIEHIPLTPSILEDNGWEKLDNAIGSPSYGHKEAKWLILCLEPDGWRAYCLNVVIKEFEFVHQLQHLLFGLGLPMNLKV